MVSRCVEGPMEWLIGVWRDMPSTHLSTTPLGLEGYRMVAKCVEGAHGVVARCMEGISRVHRGSMGCTVGYRMVARCTEEAHEVVC